MSAASPYRSAFLACLATALPAGLVTALADTLLTAPGGDAGTFFRVAGGLYLGLALLVGLGDGLVLGAVRATHGDGLAGRAWQRLRADEPLDRRLTASLVAGGVCALVFALGVASLAMGLVANVERKPTGALLLGFVAVALVPAMAMVFYPAYRVARRIAQLVPRVGGLPALAVLAGGVAVLGLALVALVVTTQLDWRALRLGLPLMLLVFFVAQAGLWLAGLPARLPAAAVLAFAALGVLGPIVGVAGVSPSPRALTALSVESQGARSLVALARRFGDRDKDGFSTLLGGGDCNDRDAQVNPEAKDVADNGVDENCNGSDAKPAVARPPEVVEKPGTPHFEFTGNVLFIAVDTLRADRLGAAGYQRGGKSLTPRIDGLVARGVSFTHAWAPAPHTPRSFPSLFTSRYPSSIEWDKSFSNYPKVLDKNQTVFESLSEGGYETVGVTSHFYFTSERGITQGFARFDNEGAKNIKDSNTDIAAPRIVPRALAELKRLAGEKKKFTMFVHLFEPHSTYVEHEGVKYEGTGRALFEEKYDREVEYTDRWVGELLDGLAAAGLAETTMIVLVSDHGEAFFTHSYAGTKLGWHGSALYDDQLRVPIIVVAPGLAPRRVDTPVMLVDVAPTLLDVLGLPIPAAFQGRSLAAALAGQELAAVDAHAELLPYPNNEISLKMLVTGDGKHKVIQNLTDRVWEIFDLTSDPGEQKNLAFDDPALAKKLQERLAQWVDGL
jgi:choline-sulfatase